MENKLGEEKRLMQLIRTQQQFYADRCPEDFPTWNAYNQLIEIVKEHFKRKEFTKGYEIKQIQQKPTVSLAEIRELLARLENRASDVIPNVYETELKRWLESKGMEVMDG